ncbi:hypothetical protein Cgig2_006290 [Carnegiea gigantea]|uniref:Uncharacterized protein n=1 Tax=Carnegiea gigantea TaxID=171969 RepID=A0A9Q1QDP6_9CARY|nr:hypothetical protein Cgig2_006290 [Carnegiea gigantea]
METGFGRILAMRIRLIPKRLTRWLLEKYDPWATSLNLPSERGSHGHDFVAEFIAYAISTCIVGNANGTCHFCVLKYLSNVNEIHKYNWCAYVIKCLNDAVNSVQFRANKVERWFLVAINWPTEKVRKRDRYEQLPGEYGRGRKIERIYYQNIVSLAEEDLEVCLQELQEDQPDTACGNQNATDYLSPYDIYYYSPEFLEEVDQLESMAREKNAVEKKIGFSPPKFSLGISHKKEPCATHSINITTTNSSLNYHPKQLLGNQS